MIDLMERRERRKEALEKLDLYGIRGAQIYLIDIIPLIEMMWADEVAQDSEIAIINEYLDRHVKHINKLAGSNILSKETAREFVSRYLRERPDPEFLRMLRSLIPTLRLSTSDDELNSALRESLLAACLDVAASAATTYPHGLQERFDPDEKVCFFEILDSLSTSDLET